MRSHARRAKPRPKPAKRKGPRSRELIDAHPMSGATEGLMRDMRKADRRTSSGSGKRKRGRRDEQTTENRKALDRCREIIRREGNR